MAEGGNSILELGYDAAAALTKYTAVKLSDDMTVTPVTAEGDVWIGITQFAVTAGEILEGKGATVWLLGTSLIKVGTGGVTRGTLGVMDAAGLVVASNTGARPLGIVLVSGVAGDYVPVLLTPGLALIP
jgi:hypothetical protein